MAKLSVEEIKQQSDQLRGRIVETLQSDATHFEEEEYQLMKFHGSYQQDDRDLRSERRKAKLEKAWSFMVRSKMPGGRLTAEQYLMHDDLANDVGNGKNMRLTTRQGIQLHGILKGGLKDVISAVTESGLTTWGACGDVVRNTMGPAEPVDGVMHKDAQLLAEEITQQFLAKSTAYSDIWLEGKKLEFNDGAGPDERPEDDIYGKLYLPRKFKIGIAVPPRNDADIFTQDIGLVPHQEGDAVVGYSIWVGGGFGMAHGKSETRPFLAEPLGYVSRDKTIAAIRAIVTTQRDHGNREDRKQARLKYLVAKQGIEWFRAQVEERAEVKFEQVKEVEFVTVSDALGWQEQGDGKWFFCVHVAQGRIEDSAYNNAKYRTAFRKICEDLKLPSIVTSNCNLIFHDIADDQREAFNAILSEHGIPTGEDFTEARKVAHACVALPTCGLSLAESERVFGGLLDDVDSILRDLGKEDEPLLIRMTGCPNGCARPYNSDFAFVGRAPRKYAMYVGGSHRGDRLAGLYQKTIEFDNIPHVMREILTDWSENRNDGETFTDYWGRTQTTGEAPGPDHFHVELAEREAARAAS